ncbi:quinone oxidoreductase family protein [Novosphingobium rosa]|uniref:quinone oxidoreductase family protein n=1 Tax=Novosphingobium rosa TaxID=76978 RepID=UPI0008361866|nr:quinone oxidoreductase [Novosphingobium rosa]
MKARQAYIATTGGPEVIEWKEVDLPAPARGEVLVEIRAVGLNFIDTYHRSGLYPLPLPADLGSESAGVVLAVGEGVKAFSVGDRVGHCLGKRGDYATARIVAANELFDLPDDVDFTTAAAILLKGGTTEFLAERAATLIPGDHALVHAAAGGVGQLLVQWLTAKGVHVIATAGSNAKLAIARQCGATHAFLTHDPELPAKVRAITEGAGVPVIYDGVGAATWDVSLKCAARRGLIVSYGNASGAVTGVALGQLTANGSLFVTRPTMGDYYATPEERAAGMGRVWSMLRSGQVKLTIGQTFPLEDVAEAHRALEARETVGSTVLTV